MDLLNGELAQGLRPEGPFAFYAQGDCRSLAREHLGDGVVDLIITDPPYGIDGDTLDAHYNRDESFVVEGYVEVPASEYGEFSMEWLGEAARALRPGGSLYVVSGWTNLHHVLTALAASGLQLVNHLIWKYNFGVFTRKKFVTSHYHVLYAVKSGERPTFNTYSRYSPSEKTEDNRSVLYADMEDVWIIQREYRSGKTRNKNMLPTALLMKMIQYSSNRGDLVADFFAGSFSTARVAKALGRSSVSFEASAAACAEWPKEIAATGWGEMLSEARTGRDDRPKKQSQPWTPEDMEKLAASFAMKRAQRLTKKAAIALLQVEFERGYFAVLNALKKLPAAAEELDLYA